MTVLAPQKDQLRQLSEGIRRGVATAEATVFVRDLCNHPSNVMTPTKIAREAKSHREGNRREPEDPRTERHGSTRDGRLTGRREGQP